MAKKKEKKSQAKETIITAAKVLEGHEDAVWDVAVSPDGRRAVSASFDNTLKVWDLGTGKNLSTYKGHDDYIFSVAITPDGRRAVSGSKDKTLMVRDLGTGNRLATLKGHSKPVNSVEITPDGRRAVSGSSDETLMVWDLDSYECLATLEGHNAYIGYWATAVTPDGKRMVSGAGDKTLKVWNLDSYQCLTTLEGHTGPVFGAAVTPDGKRIVSGSMDNTLKVWDLETGECRATWEGHTNDVNGIAVTPDGRRVVSGSNDGTLKLWDLESGACLATFKGHENSVLGVGVTPDGWRAVSASYDKTLRVWDLPDVETPVEIPPASRYTNAKVVLVGESGAGKTGLAIRLAENRWEVTESTHGMDIRPLVLPQLNQTPTGPDAGLDREVWLWDFAGQPDYRLIHQLYMDETALALMVTDPQSDDPFEKLGHWEKALAAAVKRPFNKILVAGRCDRGGATISRQKIDDYCNRHGYTGYIQTSAKDGKGCAELMEHISRHIPWDHLPRTTTTQLFKTLKDEIIAVKNKGFVLMTVPDLHRLLRDRLKKTEFSEAELRATVGLLAGQGVIQKLVFGDYVLLQPQYIDNYASVAVRSARESSDEMGSVSKTDVLEGRLDFKDMKRLEKGDEIPLLRAMVHTFLERALCLEEGGRLVFPSYFRRDRPGLLKHPDVLVTYAFTGPVDEIYATLVVRLYYTSDFEKDQLWQNAADFKTLGGKQAGFLLQKTGDGSAVLKVYFEKNTPEDTKVSFIKYIHEHLLKRGENVKRERIYICPDADCGEPVNHRKAIDKRLEKGFKDITCQFCNESVPLIDAIEHKFGSPESLAKVRSMDQEAERKIDSKSKEIILEGEARTIAGKAGLLYRELTAHEYGVDAEIEWRNKAGKATGKKLYLQLKSGDSYLYQRKRDGKEIFTIRNPHHAEYWQSLAYPVMLVIRTSDEKIRWMNVTAYLKKHGPDTKQIIFNGEPFTPDTLLKK